MSPTPRTRPGVLLLAILLAAAGAVSGRAEAYVIYLQDGSRIVTREKPTIQGANYVFLSTSGNRQMIPIAEVDQKKTDAHAEGGYGDSYVMSDVPGRRAPEGTAGGQSLSDVIRQKKITIRDSAVPGRATPAEEIVPVRPTPAPARGASSASSSSSAAPAAPAPGQAQGSLVKIAARPAAGPQPPNPNIDPQVNDAFTRALETAGIKRTQLVPAGGVLRIQAITDSEQQVFATLGAVARGLKESRALGKSVEKAEIVLATSAAENAGRFVMTAEDADAILNGKISAAKYFVANVVF
jgi:hypothetical protein